MNMNWKRWLRSLAWFALALVVTILLHTHSSIAQGDAGSAQPAKYSAQPTSQRSLGGASSLSGAEGNLYSEISQSQDNQATPTAPSLTEQATRLYQNGDYSQSLPVWHRAIAAYADDPLNQAMAYSNLSLTQQRLFQFREAEQAITSSLHLLNFNLQHPDNLVSHDRDYLAILAPSLDILGRLYWQQGQMDSALIAWRQATQLYRTLGEIQHELQSQLNQVQALQAQGNLTAAQRLLQQVKQQLSQQPDPQLQATLWRSLGNTYRLMGELKTAAETLSDALQSATAPEKPAIHLELGNLAWAMANRAHQINTKPKREEATAKTQQARQHYSEASQSPDLYVTASLNQLGLLLNSAEFATADTLWQTLQPAIDELPNSYPNRLARLTYAQHLICLKRRSEKTIPLCSQAPSLSASGKQLLAIDSLPWRTIAQLLATTARAAQSLQDVHTASYALGLLGTLYEQEEQFAEAQSLTEQALALAQSHQMGDLAYRWLWQRGRLLKLQDDRLGALKAYKAAVATLDPIRRNLLPASSDVQFDFRDNVEPLYRELVDLLLQPDDSDQVPQENLQAAVGYIDALQLAEIEDYLRCNLANRVKLNEGQSLDPHAAIIYSIILEDRLVAIAQLPGKHHPLEFSTHSIARSDLQTLLTSFLETLSNPDETINIQVAEQLYRWLIQPFEASLESHPDIQTLVFLSDSLLRNIPMTTLRDPIRKRYLLEDERYATITVPSLRLFSLQAWQETSPNLLMAGISEARQIADRRFNPLPTVIPGFQQLQRLLPGSMLLNQDFTQQALQNQVQKTAFAIVHLATHGSFSSDPDETFILTSDNLLKGADLEGLLKSATDRSVDAFRLLLLSACETAKGDHRATLGLAGIAVRSGARSTLASLWQVDDESTTLLTHYFYKALLSSTTATVAASLHQAQLALFRDAQEKRIKFEYRKPYYWSPFVLVGNWL